MVGYFKKVSAGTCISIFIVGLVTSNSHQSLAATVDPKDHTKVISDTGEGHQVFELRAGLISWLALHTTNEITEIEENLKLNRSLERKKCHSSIGFSYVESNKSLILAECQDQWRRFVKQPAWLSVQPTEVIKTDQEVSDLVAVLVLTRDIGKGEPVESKDLVREKLSTTDFSPFVSKLTEYSKLIASKDLSAGDPLVKADILVGQKVLTAVSAIPSGSSLSETLTKADIRYQKVPSDALKKSTGWSFMETNRTIMAGEIIRERHLRKAKLVRRRDPVTLVSKSPSIQIITSGTAMQDGYYGQSVKVINTESGRSVVGTVIGRGKVEINIDQ